MSYTENIFTKWLFPASIYCISCGNIIDSTRPYSLCDNCAKSFKWIKGNTCRKCGKPLAQNENGRVCSNCEEVSFRFDFGFACVEYNCSKQIIHSFKYGGRTYCGVSIAEIMFDRLAGELPETDMVLPIPMFAQKERRRGFNQADVIGSRLADMLNLPYEKHLLKRERDTGAMSRLKQSERAENINGAFGIHPGPASEIKGKRFLLVDDIYTTGSTMDACAGVLKRAGADAVFFIVFAVGSD